MRKRMRRAGGWSRKAVSIDSCTATAQRTASTTEANSAITASPQVFTSRPSWASNCSRMMARARRRRSSVAASSASIWAPKRTASA